MSCDPRTVTDEQNEVKIPAGTAVLRGMLEVPAEATAVILFAHGSGSGRFSPRNQHVARQLRHAGLATLLIDLLTEAGERIDERTNGLRFDIPFLAGRLGAAIDWLGAQQRTRDLQVGLFGASTGASAALVAASREPTRVRAVVSRGGRPDLAAEALQTTTCPTLLIVGGHDHMVIELNRRALGQLRCEKELIVVPGASHLFEEPGTLDMVAQLAVDWFTSHLCTFERKRSCSIA